MKKKKENRLILDSIPIKVKAPKVSWLIYIYKKKKKTNVGQDVDMAVS